jgi:hypothetical protein
MDHHTLLALFHVTVVSPFLIYVGVQRAATPELIFNGLLGLAGAILLYHLYRAYSKWISGSSSLWVNLIHIVLVVPILLWIGYYKKDTSRQAFEMLLLLAFSALGYHLYSLVIHVSTVSGDRPKS